MILKRLIRLVPVLLAAVLAAGCSTSKNTRASRLYHATVTRYNTWFNGNEAYKRGYEAQEKGVKDNLLEILYMYPISSEKVRQIGASDYDIAIEKAQKSIKQHSITAKPRKVKGTPTQADKDWQNKNEYNPFLWRAWMLMADSQFQKGEFIEAASTYGYMEKLYSDVPEIVTEVRFKTAQCYSEMGWNYESDELFQRSGQDRMDRDMQLEYDARLASHLLLQGRYEEAVPMLEQALERKGTSRTQRIRERYLLAQLYKETGRNSDACDMFGKVIRMSPPYEIEFQARIQQTETMAQDGGLNSVMKKLRKMERDANNKDVLDRVYYAMGNVCLLDGDTLQALEYYNTGIEKSRQATPEKGILLLTMAELYWQMADYSHAGECYSQAIGLIDTDRKDYNTIKLRSEVLEELAGYTETVTLQDSLQKLSALPEEQIYEIIDHIIADLEEQERLEEEKLRDEEKEAARQQRTAAADLAGSSGSTEWYFYNQQLLAAGRQAFRQQWGQRKLEDNWRRQDRTVLLQDMSDEAAAQDQPQDSIAAAADSAVTAITETDPHTRQYYYQQIPFTEEQKLESDRLTSSSLLGAGIIYKDRLSEYEAAEKSLRRIIDDYPQSDESDVAMYNLYLMYSLWDRPEQAALCMDYMKEQWPDGAYTKMISDPDYLDNARYGKHREDSIYAETYDAFRAGDNDLVRRNCAVSSEKYPKGANRAKFMFLEAAVCMQDGDMDRFLEILKEIVRDYPEEEISHLSGQIAQGIADGRILQSTSLASIWDRRNGTVQDSLQTDSMRPQFGTGRYEPFLVVIAYPDGEVNVNRLTFEMFRYTFSTYMMRTFDITPDVSQGIGLLKTGEFISFDEAYVFCQNLYSDAGMAEKLSGMKALIITPDNLDILLKHYSFNDYQEFYEKNFMNIPEFDIDASTLFEEYDDGK